MSNIIAPDKVRGIHEIESDDSNCVYVAIEDWGYDGHEIMGIFGSRQHAVAFIETLIASSEPPRGESIEIGEYPLGWNQYDETFDGKDKTVGYWVNTLGNKWTRKK